MIKRIRQWIGRRGQRPTPNIQQKVVVEHGRRGGMTDEELRNFLEGRAQDGAVRAANEIAERLVWSWIEQARSPKETLGADLLMARVDALMDFQSELAQRTAPRPRGREA